MVDMPWKGLYSYKMTNDSGFAPNPFGEALSLATCKPQIRRVKEPGHWIAGFTSATLTGGRDRVGNERLVYLMLVTDKMPVGDYFRSPMFRSKIPQPDSESPVERAGDNIYRPLKNQPARPEDFRQVENPNHAPDAQTHDLSGRYVLVSTRFVYFGREALTIPDHIRPNVPRGQSAHGALTRDEHLGRAFIDYAFEKAAGRRIVARPHHWSDTDTTWRMGTARSKC